MPKISVIVPVYKAERTLVRCVDSILAQTYPDFELLLIDDGSPDNSGILCDEYAKQDPRVRVFHKLNGGVSSARNLGLDNAQGEWIMFVDADDYICRDFISIALQHKSDIIMLGYGEIRDSGKIIQGGGFEDISSGQILEYTNRDEFKNFIEDRYPISGIFRIVWGKLMKKSIVGSIRFNPSVKFGEDTIFLLQILGHCNSLTYIHGQFYFYIYNDILLRYVMKIPEANVQVRETYNVYNQNGFNIEGFPIKCFHERFILCLKDIIIHPIDYINAEGFMDIAKIYSKSPRLFLINYFFRFAVSKIIDRSKRRWRRFLS